MRWAVLYRRLKPFRPSVDLVLLQTDSFEDAQEEAYLSRCDEPAPDKDEYFQWLVVPSVEHLEEL